MFHNPYLQGINLMFPFCERRQAVFIDFVVLGTDVAGRRQSVIDHLQQRGHFVEEIRHQDETLLKSGKYCNPDDSIRQKSPAVTHRLTAGFLSFTWLHPETAL